jgi:urease accessory protein
MSRSVLHLVSSAAAGVLLPTFAYAHVGAGAAGGFLHGVMHPAMGLDHVCAMVAVGLWAAQLGGRAIWAVPLTFVGVMALGGALGMAGVALPFAEQGIVLSVLMLGVLVAAAIRLPLGVSSTMVALFALCHGHAHGTEMPASLSAMAYASGFLLATATLHLLGILGGLGMQRAAQKRLLPVAGATIALCGVYLAVS